MRGRRLLSVLMLVAVTGCGGRSSAVIPPSIAADRDETRTASVAFQNNVHPIPAEPSSTGPAYAVAFQINAQHTGAIDGTGLQLPLQPRWTASLGETSTYPVIAGGRVFVGGNNLVALAASTGKTIWRKALPSIGIAYDAGTLFTMSGGGQLVAYAEGTGAQRWFAALPNQWSFTSPPTAGNGMVYTGGAGDGGTVYAVDEHTGALVWTAEVENGDDSSPVVTSSGVYVSYACPQAYDFQPLTGASIWHYSGPCEGGGGATPVLYGGKLYTETWTSSPEGLTLDAATGTPVGEFASSVAPAFSKSVGYFIENGNAAIVAIGTQTGNVAWIQTLDNDYFSVPPIVVENTLSGDLVIGGTSSGKVDIYNAHSGKLLQSIDAGAPIEGGLAFAQGVLVVPAGNQVIAY